VAVVGRGSGGGVPGQAAFGGIHRTLFVIRRGTLSQRHVANMKIITRVMYRKTLKIWQSHCTSK